MKRISTATAVNGMFVDGNRTLGQKATQFSAEWCNTIQEELCAIVELITGEAVTGLSNHEVIDALNGNRTFNSVKVGSAELKVVSGLGASLSNLAALSAGIIEALTEFKVGGSKWESGNGHPTLTGLYGVDAGNVGTTNLQTDTIDAHGEGVTELQVLKKLVGDQGQSAQSNALPLGATRADSLVVEGDAEVGGDLFVDGYLTIVGAFVADGGFSTNNGDFSTSNGSVSAPNGTVTAGKLKLGSGSTLVANYAGSESTITAQLQALASGTVAVIINKHSAALQFSGTTFYPIGAWQIPAGGAAQVIVHGDGDGKKCYPMVGTYV